MRAFIDAVTRSPEERPAPRGLFARYLAEAQDYEAMWRPVERALRGHGHRSFRQREDREVEVAKGVFDKQLDFARTRLKSNNRTRSDRVVWWMRWIQLMTLYRFNSSDPTVHKAFEDAVTEYARKSGMGTGRIKGALSILTADRNRLMAELEHLFSIQSPDIQRWRFQDKGNMSAWIAPDDLVRLFKRYENEWKQSRSDLLPYTPNAGVDVFMTFSDGFEWVDLNRWSCDHEAAAMGHCGNAGAWRPSETILSLRKKLKKGNETFWRPVCTFILDKETGMLGEMKGRENNKPIADYHHYIVALLKHPRIKGIMGGGYMAENNFSLSDLDPATREELIKEKPMLLGPEKMIERFGVSDEMRAWLQQNTKNAQLHGRWVGDEFVMGNQQQWADLAGSYGSTDLRKLVADWRYDGHGTTDTQSKLDFLHNMSSETHAELEDFFRARNPGVSIPDSKKDFLVTIRETDEDLFTFIGNGDATAREKGIHKKLAEVVNKHLDGFNDGVRIWKLDYMPQDDPEAAYFSGHIPAGSVARFIMNGKILNLNYSMFPDTDPNRLEIPEAELRDIEQAYDQKAGEKKLREIMAEEGTGS